LAGWSDYGQHQSASVIDRVTLLNDSDIIETFKEVEPRGQAKRERLI
jgi:hypothetical protein